MLHELLGYARRENLSAEPGLKSKTVRWLLVFSPDGRFLGVQDLRGEDRRSSGREFTACPDLTQPEIIAVGGGCSHFLVESLNVVVLLTKDGEVDGKLRKKHTFFVDLLDQAGAAIPSLGALAAALRNTAVLNAIRTKLVEGNAKPTEKATLALVQEGGNVAVLVERDEWHTWWREYRAQIAERRNQKSGAGRRGKKAASSSAAPAGMRCLLTGELVEPLRTQNKIEGLSDVGGLPTGDALASFDKKAFGSYGLEQGANAAMGEAAVKTYVTGFNHLIRNRSRRLAGVKVAHWYSGRVEPEQDPLAELMEGFGLRAVDRDDQSEPSAAENARERARAEGCARRLLEALRAGDPEAIRLGSFRYYAMTLSANSGRVVVRDWMEGSFAELLHTVDGWFQDLSIVSRDGKRVIGAHKFAAVLAASVRDLKDVPAPLSAAMWRCAIQRRPIPHEVMAQTLNRVRIDLIQDQGPSHARLGLLKAFCNRKKGLPNMNAELNEHENHPAYLCGRIMAILAAIQRKAMPSVGAGVVQRYYAAASATPALVLGRLIRNAQIGHLPKIDGGLRHWFEKQLADVWQKLPQAPPTVLTLEEQTLFAMGYYQQNAQQYQSGKVAADAEAANDAPEVSNT